VLPRHSDAARTASRRLRDDVRYIYELKHDGFRALAFKERGKAPAARMYRAYANLGLELAGCLKVQYAIVDGKLVVLDERGFPQFYPLLHRATSRSASLAGSQAACATLPTQA